MNKYTASVCIDSNNALVELSFPCADMITYWLLNDDSFIGSERLSNGAGLAYTDRLFASSGKGRIAELARGSTCHQRLSFLLISYAGIIR